MKKKLLSSLLVLSTTLTTVSGSLTSAFAAETAVSDLPESYSYTVSNFQDLSDALSDTENKAQNGTIYISVTANIELTETLTTSKPTVIAGNSTNGESVILTRATSNTGTLFTINNPLILQNITIDGGAEYTFNSETFENDLKKSFGENVSPGYDNGSTYVTAKDTNIESSTSAFILGNGGTLKFDNAIVQEFWFTGGGLISVPTEAGSKPSANPVEDPDGFTADAQIQITDSTIQNIANPTGASVIFYTPQGSSIAINGNSKIQNYFAGSGNGGASYLQAGTVLLLTDNAQVIDNHAYNCNGSFVMAHSGSTFVMGGEAAISGNQAVKGKSNGYNQPVYAHQNGSFYMNGGSITGNTGTYCGAVYQRIDQTDGGSWTGIVQLNAGTIEDNTYYQGNDTPLHPYSFGQLFLTDEFSIGSGMNITGEVSFYGQAKGSINANINGDVNVFAEKVGETSVDGAVVNNATITGNVYANTTAPFTNSEEGTISKDLVIEPYETGQDKIADTNSPAVNGAVVNQGTVDGNIILTAANLKVTLSDHVYTSVEAPASLQQTGQNIVLTSGVISTPGTEDAELPIVVNPNDVIIEGTWAENVRTYSLPDTYSITINSASYGTPAVSFPGSDLTENKAAAGTQVTFVPNPASGYRLNTLTVTGPNGPIAVTNNIFTMPEGDVTITATYTRIASSPTIPSNPTPTPPAPETPDTPDDDPVIDDDQNNPDFETNSGVNSGVSGEGAGFTENGSQTITDTETNTSVTYTQNTDGSKTATTQDSTGSVTSAVVTVPTTAINNNTANVSLGQNSSGTTLTIPGNKESEAAAPSVTINLPSSTTEANVTLPIESGTLEPGTVAMVEDAQGNLVPIIKTTYDEDNSTLTIPLTGSQKVVIVNNAISFPDSSTQQPYAQAASAFVSARTLMTGVGETTPKPFDYGAMTSRGQFATIMYRLESEPSVSGDYPEGIIPGL